MRIVKPNWLYHSDLPSTDKAFRRQPIYSCHVHPDGTRLVTGGLDHKIKIWAVAPILDDASAVPRLLCQQDVHIGAVLCVRWSYSGKYLASASDDMTTLIWASVAGTSSNALGFGSEGIVNVENWKVQRRLVGHTADVVDVAWATDDEALATASIDGTVLIYDAQFNVLKKLHAHKAGVKGLCWDPQSEYLMTSSDDRSSIVWSTKDWSQVESIEKPFEASPQSFFRRLSWSPDGLVIAASNAMSGPVFVGACIQRGTWDADTNLVGHQNLTLISAFNANLFHTVGSSSGVTDVYQVMALGSRDNSISIWSTRSPRPIVVTAEIFSKQVFDLSWSSDGLHLFACAQDGTLAVLSFTLEEIGEVISKQARDVYQAHIGFKKHPLTQSSNNGHVDIMTTRVNTLQVKKRQQNGKKRVTLTSHGSAMDTPKPIDTIVSPTVITSAPISATASAAASIMEKAMDAVMRPTHPISVRSASTSRSEHSQVHKRRLEDILDAHPRTRQRHFHSRADTDAILRSPIVSRNSNLKLPQLRSHLTTSDNAGDQASATLHARNTDSSAEVALIDAKGTVLWVDYLASPIIAVSLTYAFAAVACEDQHLIIFSPAGRRLMNAVRLDSLVHKTASSKQWLGLILASGSLQVWDTKNQTQVIHTASVLSFLTPEISIKKFLITRDGVPLVVLTNAQVYTPTPDAQNSWTHITGHRWRASSEWDAKVRVGRTIGAMQAMEAEVNESAQLLNLATPEVNGSQAQQAATLGHLESRVVGSRILKSAAEYRTALFLFVKRLCDYGEKERLLEVIAELYGPIYHKSSHTVSWQPMLLDLSKKDLLKDVLNIVKGDAHFSQLAQEWLDRIRMFSE